MDKLIEFACDELEELERKAEKEGSLTKSDFEYAKDLASFKKDLMKSEKLSEEGYSNAYGRRYPGEMYSRRYDDGRSYARRRDAMGRYSRGYSMANDEMVDELRDLMEDAHDEKTRAEFRKFISKIESM